MNFLNNLLAILPGFMVMFFLVFIHECGHWWCLRIFRVYIERFSVGFGKPFCRFKDRMGMEWTVAPIFLGGFVKFPYKMSDVSEDLKKIPGLYPFNDVSTLKRVGVVIGGPAVNIIFALVLHVFMAMYFSVPTVVVESAGGTMSETVQVGDRLVAVGSKSSLCPGGSWLWENTDTLTFERCGERYTLNTTGVCAADMGITWTRARNIGMMRKLSYGVRAFQQDCSRVWRAVASILKGDIKNLRGMPTIFKRSKEKWNVGGVAFFAFVAALSLSLGALNLLPVPGLDGGHLLLLTAASIFNKGKPFPEKLEKFITYTSFGLLLTLMLYVNMKDLMGFLK